MNEQEKKKMFEEFKTWHQQALLERDQAWEKRIDEYNHKCEKKMFIVTGLAFVAGLGSGWGIRKFTEGRDPPRHE